MRCPNCQADNREGVKFCEECGTKMELTCPKCHTRIPLGKKFCGECGHQLTAPRDPDTPVDLAKPHAYTPKFMAEKILTTRSAIEGERKMVTVLFADIAGFTRLSEKLDPEEVHQVMDGCFRILMDEIHSYEGTINQFTGDGVMALFGAPLTQEDHAQRACHAALAIQHSLVAYSQDVDRKFNVDFRMRIGLNSGSVVVGAIGDDLRMDYTAIGDTTNLGSRMESMADPGTTNVSENTYRIAKTYFTFLSKGKVSVKGKAEPQSIYQLLGTSTVETRLDASADRGLSRHIGRQEEIEGLNQAYEKSRSGLGQIVGVIGEAGTGKSRLFLEFRQSLSDPLTFVEGRCLQYGSSIPFLPFLDILRTCLDIKDQEPEETLGTTISKRLDQIDEKLLKDIPAFEDLLSIEVKDPSWTNLDPKEKRTRYFEAIRNLVLRISETGPLVMAIDDLQWMDKTSIEVLDYLVKWVAQAPILIVLLYRPEFTHAWGSKSYYRQLIINELSPVQSAELIQSILSEGDVSPELKDLILERAEGNPLFIEELTRTLLESGVIQKKAHQYLLTKSDSTDQVPDTIQGIIAARIDCLEDNIKRTIQLAAVIGKDFNFRILQTITGMQSELKSYLLRLQSLEFIYEKQLFPELEYIFKHSLTQEVAYTSLLQQKRRIIHEQIGEAIEKQNSKNPEELLEVLSYHYTRSLNHEKAYHFSQLAGDKTIKSHSAWEALDYYQHAFDALKHLPISDDIEKKKLEVMHLMIVPTIVLGFPVKSLSVLKEGQRLSKQLGDEKSLIRFYSNMGLYHANRGNHSESLDFSGKAFAAAEKTQNVRSMAQTGPDIVLAHLANGQFQKAYQVAFRVMKRIEDTHTETETFGGPANVYPTMLGISGYCQSVLGDFQTATHLCEKGLEQASIIGSPISLGLCENYFGLIMLNQGDAKTAKTYLEKSILHLETVQFLQPLAMALSGLGLAEAFTGNPENSIHHAQAGLKIIKESESIWHLSMHFLHLGICHYFAGNRDKAVKRVQNALQSAENQNETFMEGRTRAWLGRILTHTTDHAEKRIPDHIKRALEIFEQLATKPDAAIAELFLGEYYAKNNQYEKAKKMLLSAKNSFQEMQMGFWLDITNTALEPLS